jgi:hypothetical protein
LAKLPHNIPKEGNKDFYSTKWGLLSLRGEHMEIQKVILSLEADY